MQIGTPLSPGAVRVLLLGSGELGKEIIISLQRLGVETIAVDRYANAPGHQVAHRAHVITMTDAQALRRVLEQEHPNVVVPEIEAIATDVLLQLEKSGVNIAPSARAVHTTMHREVMRRLAAETLQVPTSAYAFADGPDELVRAIEGPKGIGYPCIVKPAISSSGKGQSLVRTAAEATTAWQAAASAGRVQSSRVMVERIVDFDYEVTLLTVRATAPDGSVGTQFCAPIGHRQVHGDYVESWQPQPMSQAALARAQAIASKITGELGGFGVFGVELFVRGDEVWFSEASARPHEVGFVTLASQAQSQFDLHARAILGLPTDVALREPAASAVIYGGIDGRAIRYDNVAHALEVPGSQLMLFGKPESYRNRRMGVALATGEDIARAREAASECASRVKPRA